MNKFFTTALGRLRLIAFFEGITLIALVFITVPLKYFFGLGIFSQILGPIHGVLFLLFVIFTLQFGAANKWQFKHTTWKVLLASVIPFGTFYIDYSIFRHLENN